MFDRSTHLLCTLLVPLTDGASDDWASAQAAVEASGEAKDELLAILAARDTTALAALLAAWRAGRTLRTVHDREVLKRAVKAFRKRLKLTRLDEESRIGGMFSKGERSGITGVAPPDNYPPDVWETLVRDGRLIDASHGLLELPPE